MSGFSSPALARVDRGTLCSGCGGCALVSENVDMRPSASGFLRPVQTGPVTDAEEKTIEAICPGLGQTVTPDGRHDDPIWGPFEEMRTGWASAPDLRFQASSGGALSAVLSALLDSGEVSAVVQIAADPDQPTGNIVVRSTTAQEVLQSAGSRYAPSAPLADLEDILAGSDRVAFVGKPCDAAALRALSQVDARVAERIPVILSFFCAGVPSTHAAGRVLDALDAPRDEVVSFRYRGKGWPGYATAMLRDGSEKSMTYHESWGGILSADVQHRCKICADGTGKAADIVCADAWETDARGYPLFEEEDGVSLVVARTQTGQQILNAAEASGHLSMGPFDQSTLAKMQPGQAGRRRALAARLSALKLLGRPVPRYRGLHIWAAGRQAGLKIVARNFLGMLRRALTGRVVETQENR